MLYIRHRINTVKDLKRVLRNAVWEDIIGPMQDYKTWHGLNDVLGDIQGLTELWPLEKWHQTFFLKIPPGGRVHRHFDASTHYKTYHIPVATNSKCESIMYGPDKIVSHLVVGGVYSIDRKIEHESNNNGRTSRVHLIVEIDE